MVIDGKIARLKPVEVSDALFISKIRNNPAINSYLSSQKEISLAEQSNWIMKNSEFKSHYFIISNKKTNVKVGTISIYNIDEIKGKAEFGRYICLNPIMAIEAVLMLIRFGFQKLELNEIYCRTDIRNIKAWNQHYNFGFEDAGFEKVAKNNTTLKIQTLKKNNFMRFDYSKLDYTISKF
jgi:RimJ/RimL family protein N-acetyltransferase